MPSPPAHRSTLISRSYVHRALRDRTGARVAPASADACLRALESIFENVLGAVAREHDRYRRCMEPELGAVVPILRPWMVERAFTQVSETSETFRPHAGFGHSVEAQEVTSQDDAPEKL